VPHVIMGPSSGHGPRYSVPPVPPSRWPFQDSINYCFYKILYCVLFSLYSFLLGEQITLEVEFYVLHIIVPKIMLFRCNVFQLIAVESLHWHQAVVIR